MALISRQICKSFGLKQVVHGVDFYIKKGHVVGLFGANGAGKTTSFLMMTGILKPDSGQIILEDYDVTQWPMYRRARLGLRYLPQEPSIFRGMSVFENLMAVAEVLVDRPARKRVVERLLEEFRLTGIAHSAATVLSGGQRRRVEIARSLIGNPSFLLLDEPLAGIDPRSIEELAQLIRHLAKQNFGILVTDHNVKDMLPIVDMAYVMHEGRVLYYGAPNDVANNAEVRALYLGQHFQMPNPPMPDSSC
ncbi:MAG: LPS export ABC transporter ATP-binding protein [Alphaproteobacteria bacterium]|nr:LPS export ABC transporter ATP-binding protein [Alphaproteobacteria bacterium]